MLALPVAVPASTNCASANASNISTVAVLAGVHINTLSAFILLFEYVYVVPLQPVPPEAGIEIVADFMVALKS